MDANKQLDKVRGCLVRGAVGDALGYPVEFSGSYESICNIYGQKGITRYSTNAGLYNQHKAYISDDTQMTLFTACGLLLRLQQALLFRKQRALQPLVFELQYP